jgi:hypothetical protein
MAMDTLKKTKEALSSIYKGVTAPSGGSCGFQLPSKDREALKKVSETETVTKNEEEK